jgi:opacity protein-like surface antigen
VSRPVEINSPLEASGPSKRTAPSSCAVFWFAVSATASLEGSPVMKRSIAPLVTTLAVAAFAAPALAGDFNNGAGGLKGYGVGSAVPVPAPHPVPDTFRYYLRADMGLDFVYGNETSESGIIFGAANNPTPFGSNVITAKPTDGILGVGTVGAGLYVTPRFRADFTADFRSALVTGREGGYAYDHYVTPFGTPPVLDLTTNTRGVFADTLKNRITTLMVNGYWDLADRGKFTPYVGVGLGIAHHRWQRDMSAVETRYNLTGPSPGPTGTTATYTASAGDEKITFAGALMAGVGYAISPGVVLDMNYRAQYIQGFDAVATIAAMPVNPTLTAPVVTKMSVPDTWEHHLRAGVRVNLW